MCGWIISLYCVAFGLSQKCFPRSKKGLRLRGLGWDFHFLETPSVLFCMVPHGTTALIFLEGMFREPPSPRGKDNGGCDVTSILGASGGKEKSWVALMSSGKPFLEEFNNIGEEGLKMAAVQPNIWTPTPVHISATHSLPSGAVNGLLDEKKNDPKNNWLSPNVPLQSFQTSWRTLSSVGHKMAAGKVQKFFSPTKRNVVYKLFDLECCPLIRLV